MPVDGLTGDKAIKFYNSFVKDYDSRKRDIEKLQELTKDKAYKDIQTNKEVKELYESIKVSEQKTTYKLKTLAGKKAFKHYIDQKKQPEGYDVAFTKKQGGFAKHFELLKKR